MRKVLPVGGWALAAALLVVVLSRPFGSGPAAALLVDPVDGLYRTARLAEHPPERTVPLGAVEAPVTVVRDARGVPHLFAESDRDAVTALGYVVAQDRLFQLDLIPRLAAGTLADVLGPDLVDTDRFLRETGMDWGARRNLEAIEAEGGVEWDLLNWYADGVNAYLADLEPEDLPLEFRLLGYEPAPYTPLQSLRLLQYMAYDLTYRTDDAAYADLRERLGADAYARLYPRHDPLAVPIVPSSAPTAAAAAVPAGAPRPGAAPVMARLAARQDALAGTPLEGFRHGKGSNNWAVAGDRSATGAPILAGDMHLALTLPAIWYEAHLVTPTMDTYGVTIPGAPLPVEAFTDQVAWAFTNTGADQIDHYALTLDEAGDRYRYEGAWRELVQVPDTIRVRGQAPVALTLLYAPEIGPVVRDGDGGGAVALRWTAHERNRTMQALWAMNHARDAAELEAATRLWDAPMQNILYADLGGTIAIRSTGYLPVRASGDGAGLLDGTTGAARWTGRVPFDELPSARNPAAGYLTSTNQQPADAAYPYYLGHDWRSTFRSLRIDDLLSGRDRHDVDDLKRYQADVHAVQRDLFAPLLADVRGLSPRADSLRAMLAAWDGWTSIDRPEPLVLDEFLDALERQAWDEPVFDGRMKPAASVLYRLLRDEPRLGWWDVQATPELEDADALLRAALEATADTLAGAYGWDPAAWRWGDHHGLLLKHITRSEALTPLWRGPVPFPGFAETLSPAGSRHTTHSASWRVVVDLQGERTVGYGVYPGGASGNPLAGTYDAQVDAYASFRHYPLLTPSRPSDLPDAARGTTLTLTPLPHPPTP